MSSEIHDFKKEAKKYWIVGLTLLVFTIITVLASHLKIGVTLAIILALIIATFKGSLVASFFMHLIHENKLIYTVLIFSAFFFLAMILLIFTNQFDIYEGAHYVP